MSEVVIVEAVRTPVGKRNGGLSTNHPADTLATVWRTHLPGAIGFYNSIVVDDLDGDGRPELYVAGSLGLWRFLPTAA